VLKLSSMKNHNFSFFVILYGFTVHLQSATPGFYKDLFMDGGKELTSRTSLPAAVSLNLSMEYLATDDQTIQTKIMIGNDYDENGILLYPDGAPRFRLIYTNGGSATGHGNSLGEQGRQCVRSFYYNGGSYSGSCAGAFIVSVSYMVSGTYEPYYHIWPGRTHTTGLAATYTGHFIPENSPLLHYNYFGGDHYISTIYHNGGCFARENVDFPAGTEILLRYDYSSLDMHRKPSCWAYKENEQSGRLVVIGSHPESVTSGEPLALMKAILSYALAGQGAPQIKGELENGVARYMNKSTSDNDPAYTKIGDRQYHHFRIDIPENTENLSVQLDGDDNFEFGLYLNRDTLAFQTIANYQGTGSTADEEIAIPNPPPGIWYVAVECKTTVQAVKKSWGYDYTGQIAVLNGASYSLTANWHTNTDITADNTDHTDDYILYQNYPNPFNSNTAIEYSLPNSSQVRLTVFNTTGRVVTILVNQLQTAGFYTVNWTALNISTGVYYYQLQTGDFQQVKKMLLVK